jgi:hypothetical protein
MKFLGRLVAVLTVVVMASSMAAPAFADDLEEYLERAADADYAGRQVVVTVWDGRSIANVASLEHSGGATMLEGDAADTVIRDGRVSVEGSAGIALSSWSAPGVGVRYTTGEERDVTRLGRSARSVTILEGEAIRARIVFDLATWAPLATEIYDGDGELYRLASFLEFDPNPRSLYAAMDDEGYDYDLMRRVEESSLPLNAGGYVLGDAYDGPGDAAQAFYSDGLFSFSVFEVSARVALERFADAEAFVTEVGEYRILVDAYELWVMWERDGTGYVLVGDLPPDHLIAVLADLPHPGGRNFWQKIVSFFG